MGKENDAMLHYLDNNRNFAALFNGCFFEGKEVVKADDLTEGSEGYVAKHPPESSLGEKTVPRIRDLKKRMVSGRTLRILAVEGQNEINYIMPWRHMNYDSLEYGKQIRMITDQNKAKKNFRNSAEFLSGLRREDRLAPTYTICLYHGTEK